MEFDTPKGKMTFRKEDHQALQSMYHFKVKVDPNLAWAVLEPVRELKIDRVFVISPHPRVAEPRGEALRGVGLLAHLVDILVNERLYRDLREAR